MKYILIKGAQDSGKSETIDAVCKMLKPLKIEVLRVEHSNINEARLEEIDLTTKLNNSSYLLEVNGKNILVVCGSPTEQKITVTLIIEFFIKLKIDIHFAIVAMRAFERSKGYDTQSELKAYGDCLYVERIYRIQDQNYKQTREWVTRIEKYNKLTLENI